MNNRKKSDMQRIDPIFLKDLNDIKLKRLKNDLDLKPRSFRRITKGIRRHPQWPNLLKDLEKARFDDE